MGISLDGGKTIYGFNPQKPESLTAGDFIERLKAGQSFEGAVTDDTAIFDLANETEIVVKINKISVDSDQFLKISLQLKQDFTNSPLTDKRYSFPKKETGGFEPNCHNCATYPETLGVKTPYPSGKLGDYLQ